jgi:aspartyl-tRNA synthetase
MAFIKNEQDIMKVEEQVVVAGIKKAVEECKEELKLLNIELKVPKIPFPELRFPEIYEILKEEGKNLKKGEDLDAEAEEVLWKHVQKKYKTDFYFINKFPFKIKPFYVYHDEEYARSVDLMCKGIELSSGGQREHRYEVLMKNIKNKKIPLKSVEWFTKFFRYGVPPHGGFALGIERLTHAILSLSNIREGTLFPRDRKRITP